MIVRLSVLNLNRNVGNSDGPFDKLCRSHASQKLKVALVIDLIGQLDHDVIGHPSVKP